LGNDDLIPLLLRGGGNLVPGLKKKKRAEKFLCRSVEGGRVAEKGVKLRKSPHNLLLGKEGLKGNGVPTGPWSRTRERRKSRSKKRERGKIAHKTDVDIHVPWDVGQKSLGTERGGGRERIRKGG